MKTRERDIARRLRGEHGLPINEISRRVAVSKSSVSVWVREQVVVSRTWVLQSIFGSIQEYAGFERPAWLE